MKEITANSLEKKVIAGENINIIDIHEKDKIKSSCFLIQHFLLVEYT